MSSKTTNATMTRSSQPFTLHLPQIFPTMTEPDTITVIHWYVQAGDILLPPPDPENLPPLLEVDAPYGEIEITVPPFLKVPHRVISILKPEHATMHLGDQFLTLQAIGSDAA